MFNQKIKENVLPKTLTNLTLEGMYNQEIGENILPSSLIYLKLGSHFNHTTVIPKTVIELAFNSESTIKNNIPDFIENITIFFGDNNIVYETIENLPSTIKIIKVDYMNKINLITKIPFGCIVKKLNKFKYDTFIQ
jgi:hypothetical protein